MRNQILRLLGVKCFAFIILGLVTFKSVAQNINYNSNTPLNKFIATNNSSYAVTSQAVNYNEIIQTGLFANKFSSISQATNTYVDQNLFFSAPGNFNTINISIANGGEIGDSLFINNLTIPGFEANYDNENYLLTITGNGDASVWQNVLREVQIFTNSNTSVNKVIQYSFQNSSNINPNATSVLFSDDQKNNFESFPQSNIIENTQHFISFNKVLSVNSSSVYNFGTLSISIPQLCVPVSSSNTTISSNLNFTVDGGGPLPFLTYSSATNGILYYKTTPFSQGGTPTVISTTTNIIGTDLKFIISGVGRMQANIGKNLNQTIYLRYHANSGNNLNIPEGDYDFTFVVRTNSTSVLSATNPTICNGSSTNLNVVLAGSSPWNLTYSDGIISNTVTNITSTPYLINVTPTNNTTTYNITQLTDNIGCSSTLTGETDITGSATITLNPRPTAVLSGSFNTCVGSSSSINVSLTGQSPWNLTYVNATGNPTTVTITAPGNGNYAIGGTPYTTTIAVSPSETTTYSITGLTDALCSSISADLSGTAQVVVNPRPTGQVSGGATICNGSNAEIAFALTGSSPWSLTYTATSLSGSVSSTTITGITSNNYTLSVNPNETRTYSITSLSDANCSANSGDKTGSAVIVVQNPITIAPIANTYYCIGSNVILAATATGVVTNYQWYLNGTEISGASSSTYSTATFGTYSVTASNTCGIVTSNSIIVAEKERPTATVTVNPNSKFPSESAIVTVTLTSTLSEWGFSYTTGSSPISITGIQASSYSFTVNPTTSKTYSLTQLQDSYCSAVSFSSASATASLTVVSLPTATISGGADFCSLPSSTILSVSLTGKPPYSLTYNTTSNGTSTSTTISGINSNLYTFTVSPNATSSYSITALHDDNNLDAISSGMTGTAKVTIPTLGLSYSNASYCQGTNTVITPVLTGSPLTGISYSATGNLYLEIDATSGAISIDASDPDVYTVTISASYNSCVLTASTTVTINTPPQSNLITSNNTICLGGNTLMTASLTGLAPFSFTYTATDLQNNVSSTTITGIQSSTYSFTVNPIQTTRYRITNLNDNYCSSNISTVDLLGIPTLTVGNIHPSNINYTPYLSVLVNPRPTSVINGTPTTCDGTATNINVALTGKSPWNITYTGSDGSSTTTTISSNNATIYTTASPYLRNLSVSPSATTTYTVTSLSDALCASIPSDLTGAATVTVNPRPQAKIEYNGSGIICNADLTTITVTLTQGTGPWAFTYTTNNGGNSTPTTVSGIQGSSYTFTVSPSSTTTYSLTALSDANSCVAQSSDINSNTTVTVNPRPKAAISGGTTICNGGTTELSVALTGTQPWSLTYTTNYGGNSTPTTVSGITTSTYTFSVSPSTTTTYSLTTLSDNNSCIAQPLVDFTTSSTIVNVNERPTAALSGTPITCDGTPTTIDVSLTGHSPWSLTYASSTGSPVTLTVNRQHKVDKI